jgi:hypothetical protein
VYLFAAGGFWKCGFAGSRKPFSIFAGQDREKPLYYQKEVFTLKTESGIFEKLFYNLK